MTKWDARFLDLARLVATWSKDPSTGVGAVITDAKNRVVSLGFNGFPRGVVDDPLAPREEKLRRTIHAEENAILFAAGSLAGCTIYTTHHPCARCAAKIIQAGITRVVAPEMPEEFLARWGDEMRCAEDMFREARVAVTAAGNTTEKGEAMYYEEKVIDGRLCCRSTPGGEWRPATSAHATAVNALLALPDEQRMEAFGFFCCHCGTDNPHCQCWNDE